MGFIPKMRYPRSREDLRGYGSLGPRDRSLNGSLFQVSLAYRDVGQKSIFIGEFLG